jgi:hypothetical protein
METMINSRLFKMFTGTLTIILRCRFGIRDQSKKNPQMTIEKNRFSSIMDISILLLKSACNSGRRRHSLKMFSSAMMRAHAFLYFPSF